MNGAGAERWQAQRRKFAAPPWLGEGDVAGKTILLHAEQGFGDTHPVRALCAAPRRAWSPASCSKCSRSLVRLLSSVAGVAQVLPRKASLPPFDLHCPLLSLPLAFGTALDSILAAVPYVAPPRDAAALWQRRLTAMCVDERPQVGLAWSGERAHDNDLNRSISLDTLAPVLDLPHVQFVSLQHDVREDGLRPSAGAHRHRADRRRIFRLCRYGRCARVSSMQ